MAAMSYVKKTQKAKNALNDGRYLAAVKRSNIHFKKREYLETNDGYRIRIWTDPNHDFVRDEDVRGWLLNTRAIEDLQTGLEFVRESYIKGLIRDGYLRQDKFHKFYWITAKAADRFKLPRVMGCKFPK
jgi:hypothetical protein